MTTHRIPVSALHERVPHRPSRLSRRWRVYRRRGLPWALFGLGAVIALCFAISLLEVAAPMRPWSALGVALSSLLAAGAFTRVPGGWRTYVHGGRGGRL